ncbi:hypothetical protein PRUPE_1G007600 [Prunus persica]|uniref:Uncharacterized protein n=1 Tax=Prunus persica TaxID=3760 RepID=M5XFB0_PRUPE|nr:hypothetical protein PRUPE_1G007600 [Prunus persica]
MTLMKYILTLNISSYHFVDLLSHSSSYLLSNRGRQSWHVLEYYFFFFIPPGHHLCAFSYTRGLLIGAGPGLI